MVWIKRNLFLVIGSLVGLGLLGGAGYFLYAKMEDEKQVDADWRTKLAELDRLNAKNLQRESIDAVKEEQKKIQALVLEFHKRFAPIPHSHSTNNYQFKTNLDSTIFQLERAAEAFAAARSGNHLKVQVQVGKG